jgi:hypothetical protein
LSNFPAAPAEGLKGHRALTVQKRRALAVFNWVSGFQKKRTSGLPCRGFYYDSLHRQNGFLFSNGNYTTLDDPLGINGTYATGISDASVIVGYYLSNGFNSDGGSLASIGHGFLASEHGSLASTVPEPSTWAMMLIGFAGIGFVTYRRTKKNTTALAAA